MKINRLLAVILLGYWVIALNACAKQEIKNIGAKGKNIVCFGDSITFGYGVQKEEDYPFYLSRLVKAQVINAGIDGDTSIEGLKRMETDVLKYEPFLVIVEFCGNDFLRKIPKETTIDNVRQMVRKAQARGSMVVVVDISAGLFLKEYREAFGKLAREEGAIFIPAVLNGIITNPGLKSDFLHPNKDGYRLISQRVYREIEPYLPKRGASSGNS